MTDKYKDLKKLNDRDNIAGHYGMEIESLCETRCVISMKIRDDCLNYHGTLHGALYYAMADMSSGVLAHVDGRSHVTLSGELNFMKTVSEGTVRAVSEFEHSGRKTSVLSVHIYDDNDTLLASGNYTFYCVGEKKR